MGVTFDDDYSAFCVHPEAGGCDDVGRFGDEFDDDARVGRLGCICSNEHKGKGGQREERFHGKMNGASERIRTVDLLITNELLYQLSYGGNYLLKIQICYIQFKSELALEC